MDRPRYRHAEGVRCGCKRRSVTAEKIEGDFLRLVQLLTLKEEAHHLMMELAMRISVEDSETHDLETERRAAIALLRQQLSNLLDLYKNAIITTEEYYRDRADRERQIAFWEARTTEHRKKAIELEQVMVAFSQLLDLWAGADSDERSRLAASLFQYLVIDLDKEQIVDFRLHAWADQYLCLRAELYDDGDSGAFGGGSEDNGPAEGNKNRFTSLESDEAIDDPNGRKSVSRRDGLRSISVHSPKR